MPIAENWSYKDIPDFYSRVRMVLNNCSDSTLPDTYIDTPEKAGYADRYIKSRVINWKDLDESKFAMFESAIVYMTSSLFQTLVASSSIKRKKAPTMEIEYFDEKPILAANEMTLNDMVEALINEISGYGNDIKRFVVVG